MLRILCVAGTRPNFVKVAPLLRALRRRPEHVQVTLVHTGQHHDTAMSGLLFEQLGIPAPDVHLNVSGGSHATQTAEIMKRFEPALLAARPDVVLVVGDVNSTLACALVARKADVRVVHVEAGLRSFDRSMPEEINRILTDQLSDRLYATEPAALENLAREGISPDAIVLAGNAMIDSLQMHLQDLVPPERVLHDQPEVLAQLESGSGFGLVTMHRPSNVDRVETLTPLLAMLSRLSRRLPLLLPAHPRTRANLERFGLMSDVQGSRLHLLPPLGYLEMLGLMRAARLVLTDSGGVQEETTALGVPCITMRDNTERPITVTQGTNVVAGSDPEAIHAQALRMLDAPPAAGGRPDLWDGHAAERVVEDLVRWLGSELGYGA